MLLRGGALSCVRSLKLTTTTIPYVNPDAMVHVLLTLNEPLLQRSRCTWSPRSVPHHKTPPSGGSTIKLFFFNVGIHKSLEKLKPI